MRRIREVLRLRAEFGPNLSAIAAGETTPEGKPVRLKLRRVTSFCNRGLSSFAKRSLDPACEVVSACPRA